MYQKSIRFLPMSGKGVSSALIMILEYGVSVIIGHGV